MKTLKEMYDTAELCGYIPTSIWGGIGFIELSSDDEFRYRTDDYYVVCSIGTTKPFYRHCKVHYNGDKEYVIYRGMKIYLDEVMRM